MVEDLLEQLVAPAHPAVVAHPLAGVAGGWDAPWDSRAERDRMAADGRRVRRAFVARRKSGRDLAVKPARKLDAEREAARETHWTEDESLRRELRRRSASGRAAYDTARALYLRLCPDLERKLLHLLRRDGPKPEAEFLSRHRALAEGGPDQEGAARAALERLHEAGKVRRLRSRKTGEVFVAATEPLDEPRHRRELNSLIRDGGYGIVNPWTVNVGVAGEGVEAEQDPGFVEQPLRSMENVADEGALAEIEAVA